MIRKGDVVMLIVLRSWADSVGATGLLGPAVDYGSDGTGFLVKISSTSDDIGPWVESVALPRRPVRRKPRQVSTILVQWGYVLSIISAPPYSSKGEAMGFNRKTIDPPS